MYPTCGGCSYIMPCCDCQTNPRLRDTPEWQNEHRFDSLDSGYGYWNGNHIYYEFAGGKINVFAPNPFVHNHDHVVLVGAGVTVVGGTVYISGGTPIYARVDGEEIVSL